MTDQISFQKLSHFRISNRYDGKVIIYLHRYIHICNLVLSISCIYDLCGSERIIHIYESSLAVPANVTQLRWYLSSVNFAYRFLQIKSRLAMVLNSASEQAGILSVGKVFKERWLDLLNTSMLPGQGNMKKVSTLVFKFLWDAANHILWNAPRVCNFLCLLPAKVDEVLVKWRSKLYTRLRTAGVFFSRP